MNSTIKIGVGAIVITVVGFLAVHFLNQNKAPKITILSVDWLTRSVNVSMKAGSAYFMGGGTGKSCNDGYCLNRYDQGNQRIFEITQAGNVVLKKVVDFNRKVIL